MSKEARIYREFNGLPSLFTILQEVNSAFKGSFDFSTFEEFDHRREALRLTIQHWEAPANDFEELLHGLVSEALAQCVVLQDRYQRRE